MDAVLKRDGCGEIYELKADKKRIIMGRNPACDITFNNKFVSRQHCEILRVPPHGSLIIKNLQATNATYVDELILRGQEAIAELRPGCRIGLGVPLAYATGERQQNQQYVFLTLSTHEVENDNQICSTSLNETASFPEVQGNQQLSSSRLQGNTFSSTGHSFNNSEIPVRPGNCEAAQSQITESNASDRACDIEIVGVVENTALSNSENGTILSALQHSSSAGFTPQVSTTKLTLSSAQVYTSDNIQGHSGSTEQSDDVRNIPEAGSEVHKKGQQSLDVQAAQVLHQEHSSITVNNTSSMPASTNEVQQGIVLSDFSKNSSPVQRRMSLSKIQDHSKVVIQTLQSTTSCITNKGHQQLSHQRSIGNHQERQNISVTDTNQRETKCIIEESPVIDLTQEDPEPNDPVWSMEQSKVKDFNPSEEGRQEKTEGSLKRKRNDEEETQHLKKASTNTQEMEDPVEHCKRRKDKKNILSIVSSDSEEEEDINFQSRKIHPTRRIVSDTESDEFEELKVSLGEKVQPKRQCNLTTMVNTLMNNTCSVLVEKLDFPVNDSLHQKQDFTDGSNEISSCGHFSRNISLHASGSLETSCDNEVPVIDKASSVKSNLSVSTTEVLSHKSSDISTENSENKLEGKSTRERVSVNYKDNTVKCADAKENEAPEPPAKRHKRQNSSSGDSKSKNIVTKDRTSQKRKTEEASAPTNQKRKDDCASPSCEPMSDDDLPDVDILRPHAIDLSVRRGSTEKNKNKKEKCKSRLSKEPSVSVVSTTAVPCEIFLGDEVVDTDDHIFHKPKLNQQVKSNKEREEDNIAIKIKKEKMDNVQCSTIIKEKPDGVLNHITIKKEPQDIDSAITDKGNSKGNDDDEDNDISIEYSQLDDPIWISSDEEDTDSAPTSLNDLSFGPPPSSPELLLEELFDDHDKQNDSTKMPKEAPVTDDDFDDDQWFPVLSQSFLEDENDCETSTKAKEPVPGPSGIHSHKKDDFNDEDKWLELSQGFIDDDIDFEDNKASKKDTPDSSQNVLLNTTEKQKSKDQRKSQLIDPKMPPPRTKNDSLRRRGLGNATTSKRTPDLKSTSEFERKSGEDQTSKWISSINKHTKLITPPKKTHRKKGPSLRDNLTSKFNLESYKATVEHRKKAKHHLVSKDKDDTKKDSTHKKSHLITSGPHKDENISIQKKASKGDTEGHTKSRSTVAAKVTSNNRSQRLIGVNLFPSPAVPKTQSRKYKIPKNDGTAKKIDTVSENVLSENKKEPPSASCVTASEPRISDKKDKMTVGLPVQKDCEKYAATCKDNINSILKGHIVKNLKRRVHFPTRPEDLVQVRYISPCKDKERTGTLSVKIKEVLPKELLFLKYKIPNNYFDQFIYFVCRWNYDWLESYRIMQEKHSCGKLKDVFPPPIVESTTYPTLILYHSYHDYKDIFSTLMYYELWENIYQDWLQFRNTSRWLPGQIDILHPPNKDKRVDMPVFWLVKIITLITQEQSNRGHHPKQGSLIALKLHEGKKRTVILGYVDDIIKSRKRNVTKELESVAPQGEVCLLICLRVTKDNISTVQRGKIIYLSHISYIRPATRVWEGLCKLPLSPLCGDILNPSEEVFKCSQAPGDYIIHEMPLNHIQKKAVIEVSSKCMIDELVPKISLIHGPPGTGKTRTITALIAQIVKISHQNRKPCRILLCAPSNAAVDELSLRLIKLKQIGISLRLVRVGAKEKTCPELRGYLLDSFVQKQVKHELTVPKNVSLRQEWERKRQMVTQTLETLEKAKKENKSKEEIKALESCLNELVRAKAEFEKSYLSHPNSQERYKLHQKWQEQILLGAEVISVTLGGSVSGVMYDILSKQPHAFTCCIIDEAGQCKETETWLPLLYGVRKLVMVGDHKQLPATVISQLALDKNLKQSLFERFFYRFKIELRKDSLIHSLSVQYRMHPEIAEWPSQHFYLNKLSTNPDIIMERTHNLRPYLVFDLKTSQEQRQNNELYNPAEISLIRIILEAIEPEVLHQKVAVLTPYQCQKYKLEEKLARFFGRINLSVNTIDAFQGQEMDIVILSFVRANKDASIGFLSQQQRLNVALTRARKSCFIVGSLSSLSSNKDWQSLIQNAERRDLIRTITEAEENDRAHLRKVIFK